MNSRSAEPSCFAFLLLQCLHDNPQLPDPANLAAFGSDAWRAFTTAAIHYRMAFQVHERLLALPARCNLVPAACLEQFKFHIRQTLLHNLGQQARLYKILKSCHAAGIPVILNKGLWLVETVYHDLKARASGDIDLLLKRSDMPRFTQLALEMGFNLPGGIHNICDLAPDHHAFLLTREGSEENFDVHWALVHPHREAPIDEDKLWQRSEWFRVAGLPCRSLGVEDHLLYLCYHIALHHRFLYVGPRALFDVARLISDPPRPIDWSDMVTRAHELGWSESAWLVFDLIHEHLGIQPPQFALDAMQPAVACDNLVRKAAIEMIFLDQAFRQKLDSNALLLLDNSLSWQRRISVVLSRLLPPREYIATYFKVSADSQRIYWLYVKRWVLMLREHTPKLLGYLRGDLHRNAELKRRRVIERWIKGR